MRDLILFSFDCETDLQFYYWKPNVSCVVNLWTWATLNLDFMYLTNWFSCLLLDLPLLPISILSFMSQNLKKFVGSMQGVFYTLPWGFNGEIQTVLDSKQHPPWRYFPTNASWVDANFLAACHPCFALADKHILETEDWC